MGLDVREVVNEYRMGSRDNDGNSQSLRKGEVFGVLGPNGAVYQLCLTSEGIRSDRGDVRSCKSSMGVQHGANCLCCPPNAN